MIINIRGTSGSGKTYTTTSFMKSCGQDLEIQWKELGNYAKPDAVAAHVVFYKLQPVYFIGSYRNVCGGCDTIKTQDLICSLVRHFAPLGHVVFEGLLASHLFARYAALYQEMRNIAKLPFVIAYMDTPLEICIERVKQRRLEKGNEKELDPSNTISHYNSTWDTFKKFNDISTVSLSRKFSHV